ncbi:sensor histidine kinase [Roseateles oligotrophus]|uniref:sensor histidine kinase n=1 Tax=Roseateles oligotrophus TaxID=1769250 RepID=UPI0021E5025C|nr:HAMP domain-containing sensor histidine kinase [Roseateles oligotrophus]
MIKIYELLLQHPDPVQAGQDVRAWAAELARLHEQRSTLQMEVVARGFEGMVQSAEIAGQNRALRQHGDELTRELAGRNQVLSETVAELSAQGLRRERAEAALQQAHDELELRVVQRTEQLHEARLGLARAERMASLSRLVSGVAHRLNTPLGNARMAVSCVGAANAQFKQRMTKPMTRHELAEFVESGSQAAALAESSLARATELMTVFKQVSTLEHVESASAFDPAALVRDAALLAGEYVGTKKVEIHFDMPALPVCQGYPQMLLQVLKQLLVNALVYGQKPGEDGGVWVAVRADSGSLCISVRDQGPGISAAKMECIFEPFNSDLSGVGLGLGLHIARNLVTDLSQGSLTVSSTPGQGACFTLQVPLNAV